MCNCELAKTPTHAPMFYVMYVWRWPVRTAETWSDVKYSPSVMLRYLDENVFLAHMKPCHGVFKSYLIDKYDKKNTEWNVNTYRSKWKLEKIIQPLKLLTPGIHTSTLLKLHP